MMTKKTSHTKQTQNPKPQTKRPRKKLRTFATMHSIIMLSVLTQRWKMSGFCHLLMIVVFTIKSIIALFVLPSTSYRHYYFSIVYAQQFISPLFIDKMFLFACAIVNWSINKNDTWKQATLWLYHKVIPKEIIHNITDNCKGLWLTNCHHIKFIISKTFAPIL